MTPKSKTAQLLTSRNGQSTIEALAVSVALIAFVSVLAAVLYFGLVHVGMNYLIHENLVCEQTEGAGTCRQDFLKSAKPFLVFAKMQTFEVQRRGQKVVARLVLRMPFQKTLQFKDELGLYR